MVGPIAPLDPIAALKPMEPMGSGAPAARGPRVQGQNAPKLGEGLATPMPKMPAVALPKIQAPNITAQPVLGTDTISMAFDQPAVTDGHTVSGFVKNLTDDVYGFISGVPAAFKVAWNATGEIIQNRKWIGALVDNPELVGNELKRTWNGVLQHFTDQYKDGIGEALYRHPFSTTMDALALFDVVGVPLKMAGKTVGLVDAASGAKLTRLAESIQSAPGRMIQEGLGQIGNAAMKVPQVKTIAQSFALDPMGLAENRAFTSIHLRKQAEAAERGLAIIKQNVPKKLWGELEDVLDGYKPRDHASTEGILARSDEWVKRVVENESFYRNWTVMSDQEMATARLKNLAIKMHERGDYKGMLATLDKDGKAVAISQEALDAAAEWSLGKNPWGKPTTTEYSPLMHERMFSLEGFCESLGGAAVDKNFVSYNSRLQSKTGMPASRVLDPDVWTARSVMQQASFEATLEYLADAQARGMVKPVPVSGVADAGWTVVPHNSLLRKYTDNLFTAQQMLIQKIAEAKRLAKPGEEGAAIAKAMKDTMGALESDPSLGNALRSVMEQTKGEWAVQVPKQIAYILQANMHGPRGLWRFYDRAMNTWRDIIMSFMPRYYLNGLLGNATLLTFAGHNPFTKLSAFKEMPAEAMNSSSLLGIEGGIHSSFLGAITPNWVRQGQQWLTGIIESRPRGLLTADFAKEILAREAAIGNTAAKTLIAQEGMEGALNAIFKARNDIRDLGYQEMFAARRATETGQAGSLGDVMEGKAAPDAATVARRMELESQIKRIQGQLNNERSIVGNANADKRIADLKDQLNNFATQLHGLTKETGVSQDLLKVAPDIEEVLKLQEQRKYLEPYAALAERAVQKMEGWLGNYGRLHPLEREWMRRAIPFWTFAKTMTQLVFQLPFMRPKTSFLWNQYARMMLDAANDDRLPSRYKNQVLLPLGGTKDGQFVFMKIGSFNPWEAAKMSEIGGVPGPGLLDLAQHPLIKLFLETRGGYDTFTERPFTKPTDFVSLDGRVWRFDPETKKLEVVIPQKPLVSALLQQIPHVRIVQEALDSIAGARDPMGAVGLGITPKGPDGTYSYNRQWWYAAARALGFPISVSDPQRVAVQNQLLLKGISARFRSAGKRVDPETRDQLEKILGDMATGEFTLQEGR